VRTRLWILDRIPARVTVVICTERVTCSAKWLRPRPRNVCQQAVEIDRSPRDVSKLKGIDAVVYIGGDIKLRPSLGELCDAGAIKRCCAPRIPVYDNKKINSQGQLVEKVLESRPRPRASG
jgi:hypothetical protein